MTLAGGGMGPQPVLEVLPPNEYDGVRWRLLFDVAIGVTDYRGAPHWRSRAGVFQTRHRACLARSSRWPATTTTR